MAQTSNSEKFSISEAARYIGAGSRQGKPLAPSTVFRWITTGVRVPGGKLRLRAERIGGSWRVNKAAIDEFIRELTEAHRPEHGPPLPQGSGRRDGKADRAGRQLQKMGA